MVYCVLSHGEPPTSPPPRTPQGAPHSHAYIETFHAGPYAFTRQHMTSTQVSLLYTPGAICTLSPFPPPPYLYTSRVYRAFSLSTYPPPSKRERDVQQVQVEGGGRGTKADTSLFLVSADHMRGSNILKMSSIEAHGHMGSPPPPPRASVAEAAHGSAYSFKQARGRPPLP